jgi:siroheme synthase (precorrin-2 oxidase/ferrochelatase)
MSRKLKQTVKETITELLERGIDASMMQSEIEQIIDDRWPHYEAERDWESVARQLGLY